MSTLTGFVPYATEFVPTKMVFYPIMGNNSNADKIIVKIVYKD